MRARKTIPIYPKNGTIHEMPETKPTSKPVAAAHCQAESTSSCKAQAANMTSGKSAIPESKYTRLITADCRITVNKMTGTATKLRILYGAGIVDNGVISTGLKLTITSTISRRLKSTTG